MSPLRRRGGDHRKLPRRKDLTPDGQQIQVGTMTLHIHTDSARAAHSGQHIIAGMGEVEGDVA